MLFFPGPNHLDGYNDLRPEGLIRKDRPTFTQLEIKFIWSEKIIRFSHSWRYYSLCSIWIEINSDMVLMKSKLLIIKRCLPKKNITTDKHWGYPAPWLQKVGPAFDDAESNPYNLSIPGLLIMILESAGLSLIPACVGNCVHVSHSVGRNDYLFIPMQPLKFGNG